MGSESRDIYRFDRCTLNLSRGTLLGPDGAELPLRPKSFALLRYLVSNAGRLVARDELMNAVWPGVFVTDDSIAQCVKDIRRALGDDTQRLLRTIPRRGYLLAADISRDPPPAATPISVSPEPAQALPVPTADRPMLVVLPFENIGGDPDRQYLASGITADLVTDLTRFEDLHVVSPSAHARRSLVSGTSAGGWTIPEEASYVVAGNVRHVDGRMRVTVRLDDARTGISLWAERFDRPAEGLMELQEEIVELLPSHLVIHIEREGARQARRRPTNSLGAYELCLRGREHHVRATEPDTSIARELFDRAIQLDPDFASAYAWQAFTVQRGFTRLWGEPRGQEAARLALALARTGVALDPESSLCLARLGFVLLLNHEWDEALRASQAAVLANPSAAESRFRHGDVLAHAGDPVEAEREIRLALALNPFHPPTWRVNLARAMIAVGRWEEALAELRFCYARMPHYELCLESLAAAAAVMGDTGLAREAVASLLRGAPDLTVRDKCARMCFRDDRMTDYHWKGLLAGGMAQG